MQTQEERTTGKQKDKSLIRKEIDFWKEQFNKSMERARISIFRTIDTIAQERQDLHGDNRIGFN